jgi:flavin reductase (DIM6/NTAB) family NADH-FMN oxidoreductase RutF
MFKTIDPAEISNTDLHKLMLGAIAPRPIAFASTVDSDGKPNLSPFSFFNAFGVNPSTIIFSPSRRGRDASVKHTYENIMQVPEVVINAVTYNMVEQVSLASTEFAKGINEFEKAGFTPIASERIRPFRVKESPVQWECKVRQVIETGKGGGAANLMICEVLLVHVNEDILDANGLVDQQKIDLVGRMGGDYYVRAHGDALFEVEKPLQKPALGVNSLPINLRNSHVLTGNELGRLGSVEFPPSEEELTYARSMECNRFILEDKSLDAKGKLERLHLMVQAMLNDGEKRLALATGFLL